MHTRPHWLHGGQWHPQPSSRWLGPSKRLGPTSSAWHSSTAITGELVGSNPAEYCIKQVMFWKDGKQVAAPDAGDLFVSDSCDRLHICAED